MLEVTIPQFYLSFLSRYHINYILFIIKIKHIDSKDLCFIVTEELSREKEANDFGQAFNKENLSDCGISKDVLDLFCSTDPEIVQPLDSVKYNPEDDTYTW